MKIHEEIDLNEIEEVLEEVLLPYSEHTSNLGEDFLEEYCEFQDETDEALCSYEIGTDQFVIEGGEPVLSHAGSSEEKTLPYNEVFSTFEEFVEEFFNMKIRYDGRVGYYYNPNSLWDWWVLGGRWKSLIIVKPDSVPGKDLASYRGQSAWCNESIAYEEYGVDFAKIKDIDFGFYSRKVEEKLDWIYKAYCEWRDLGFTHTGYAQIFGEEVENVFSEPYRIFRRSQVILNYSPSDRLEVVEDASREQFREVIANFYNLFTYYVLDDSEKPTTYGEEDNDDYHNSFYEKYLRDEDPETIVAIVDMHS